MKAKIVNYVKSDMQPTGYAKVKNGHYKQIELYEGGILMNKSEIIGGNNQIHMMNNGLRYVYLPETCRVYVDINFCDE